MSASASVETEPTPRGPGEQDGEGDDQRDLDAEGAVGAVVLVPEGGEFVALDEGGAEADRSVPAGSRILTVQAVDHDVRVPVPDHDKCVGAAGVEAAGHGGGPDEGGEDRHQRGHEGKCGAEDGFAAGGLHVVRSVWPHSGQTPTGRPSVG